SAEFYSHAGGTEVGWVDATYRNLLGRPADAGGRAYWVEQLQQGASRSDVAFGFAASLERESQRVQVDYQHFLRRAASPSELSYWVSQFAAGVTNESLIGGFVGSPEYFQFAQTSPETQPPAIVSTFPADDTSVDVAPQTVLIGFSKAVNASTVTAQSVQLQGPTGPVASTAVGLLAGGTTAQLAYPALAVGEYQLTIHAASITDTTGNGLAGGDVVEHFHVDSASDVWINPAGGDWNAPSNWSTGVVPGPNDDVLINTPGGATIDYSSGFATIKNLTSANPLSVSGGGITFASGASQVDGALSMSNSAQLVALGAGVTFAAKGSVSIGSGAVLSAVGGGLIDLSSLTSFSSTFDGGASISAAGTGSKVELSNLTLLHGSGSGSAVSFSASQGGLVDLSRLAEIPDGSVQIRASDPGSKIDLSALTTFTASGFVSPGSASGDISAVNGGSILVPLLTTARNFSIYLDGRASSISTGQITNIDSVSLSASDGAILDLNGVTSYLATSTAFPPISISAQGPGSIISLPNLIVLHGAANAPNGQSFVFPVFFQATAGGELNLPRLTQIPDGAVQFAASGANSTINLSALATYVGAGQSYSWQVTDGGAIVAPQLSTLRDATLDVDGAGSNISTALLANVDALNINATDGAVVDLNGVTRYAGANGVNFRAGGAGSAIDLSNLTTLDGTAGGRLGINASGGARIDLHRLSQVADGGLNVSVSSANSTIDLVALTV
ncbi:MAG TPA: DUF4214 domain-containing protein, partial [Pirellulales bacterium]|nr:DUF4214 domain-containing protein [Pirellulales bacterium]